MSIKLTKKINKLLSGGGKNNNTSPIYILKIILSIISVIILIYLFSCENEYNTSYNNKLNEGMTNPYNIENKYHKYHENDLNSKITNMNKDKIYYLYWTGGYDSTFRLCEMLIDEGKKVQPIYVALVLDNDCVTEETCTKLWLRRNRKEEKLAMQKIIEKIKTDFPNVADNLLDLLVIDEPINDDNFNYHFENLFYNNNLWPKKRKKHQYLFLSKYAFYHKKNIDIGVLGIHEKSKLAKYLNKNLVKTDDNYIIKKKEHPLSYLNFPLFGRTKEDLLEKSKLSGYDNILRLSWSCWFPNDGKPCGKCPMCKERIVEHPKN